MNKPGVASCFGLMLLLGASSAWSHDPEPTHEHADGGHEGVYDHGHDDGHHHHPHVHEPAPAPPPPPPYTYNYGYSSRVGYPSHAQAAPRVIEGWEPGDPVPDGYRPDTRSRSGLVKAGAATLFSVYGLTAIVGSFFVLAEDVDAEDGVDGNGIDSEDYYPLFIPVVGPFVTIGTAQTDRAASTVLVANGIAQTAGLAMFIAGFAAQQDVLVRIPTYGQAVVEMKPLIGAGFQGVGVNGSF